MSTFTIAAGVNGFNLSQPNFFDVGGAIGTGSDEFGSYVQWNTTSFNTIRAYSTDLVVDANNVPVSGTFTFMRIFIGSAITVTDIAIDVTALSYVAGQAASDANTQVLLDGATTFNGDPASVYAAFGDIREVSSGSFTAASDTFTGKTNDAFHGDTVRIGAGATLNGGDDTFNILSNVVYGDTEFIAGNGTIKATLNGGDDHITATGDIVFTRVYYYGDAGDLLTDAVINGGDDVIDASLILSTTLENILIGDGFSVNSASTVVGGDDTITGSQAVDTIYGDINSNNSVSSLTGGDDILDGQSGNDRIYGDYDESRSAGTLIGGNDIIRGGAGDDIIQANAGDDWVDGGADDDIIDGGDGIDTLSFASASARVTVSLAIGNSQQNTIGSGLDTITRFENLEGSAFRDTLTGDDQNNGFKGGRGNDTITGGLGNDTVDWTTARQSVVFTLAADGSGVTENVGGINVDTLSGIENLWSGSAADVLTGNRDINVLEGNGNADILNGKGGNDNLSGGDGNDRLNGGQGRDTLLGGAGKDTLIGGDESDDIDAGSGADIIDGGAGNDILTGTADGQVDEFYFRADYDLDRVYNFEQGRDELHLDDTLWGGGLTAAQVVMNFGHINGAQSVLTLDFGDGDVLVLRSLDSLEFSSLSEDIFII